MKNWVCDVKLSANGFTVLFGNKYYPVVYPSKVWQAFALPLRLPFAQFIAFMTTVHWTFGAKRKITYNFPAPLAESLFYYGLFLSMPENLNDFDNSYKTSDYLKFVFNSFFKTSFTGHSHLLPAPSYKPQKTAIIPFTFGKDSLLTLALCRELGIKPIPIYCIEKHKTYENDHRYRLIKQFKKEFGINVITFEVPLQKLKQHSGLWWGWDIFLTQYTFFLIPFMHFYKASYFFWSNEYDRSIVQPDREGFMMAPTFDQTARWLQVLDRGIKLFGAGAQLGSLLEPLTELAVHHVLHHRFPAYGKFQTSCNHEEVWSKTQRWCGHCITCAEDYIFLKALGIDLEQVDYRENMLTRNKRTWHHLFKKNKGNYGLHNVSFFRNQHIYALYLAYKRGLRGGLMNEFEQKYLPFANRNKFTFQKEYLTVNPSLTTPLNLTARIKSIFNKELTDLKKNFKKLY